MSIATKIDEQKENWLQRLAMLIQDIKRWSEERGVSTKQIEITLNDSCTGKYKAPALLIQEEAVRMLLEPIAMSTLNSEGVVDLYLMPSYDDLASIYFRDNQWHVHYMFSNTPTVATISDTPSIPFNQTSFNQVLDEMKRNAD
jgi:hypothetical protein